MTDDVSRQEHYTAHKIQPIEYIMANGLNAAEGNVVKYITRWRHKGGVTDLKKARQYLDWQIEYAMYGEITIPGPESDLEPTQLIAKLRAELSKAQDEILELREKYVKQAAELQQVLKDTRTVVSSTHRVNVDGAKWIDKVK